MKLTRLIAAAGFALALRAAMPPSAVIGSPIRERLRITAPSLAHPITERYPEPATPEDAVKRAVWDRINADRAAHRLPPVAWDEAASKVADAFCAEQIREGTSGHFLTNGLPPYARTAFAGVFGAQSENAVAWISSGQKFDETTIQLALSGQENMMAEVPPYDGHRRTILDPDGTHVGVGYAQERGSFRMAQEFTTRRFASMTLSQVAGDPDTVLVEGKALRGFRPEFVTLAHEPPPARLTRAQANERDSYRYPTPGLSFVPVGAKSLQVVGTRTEDQLHVDQSGSFSFRFTPSLAGIWTIQIYAGDGRENAKPGGIAVLRVERAP